LVIFSTLYIRRGNLRKFRSNTFRTTTFFFNIINFYKLTIVFICSYKNIIDSDKQCCTKDVVESCSLMNIELKIFFKSLESKLQLIFIRSWCYFFYRVIKEKARRRYTMRKSGQLACLASSLIIHIIKKYWKEFVK